MLKAYVASRSSRETLCELGTKTSRSGTSPRQVTSANASRPVMILHGGPGSSYLPATSIFLNWEKYFTVVQWDQRGTGRTFGLNGEHGSGEMSVDRMSRDGVEVIDYLRQRFHQDKIILYGTSWGTILGTIIAQRRPDLLSAYVGSGQVVDEVRDEYVGYETLLRTVKQMDEPKAITELTAIGPPPYKNFADLGIERRWFWRNASSVERNFLKGALAGVILAPDYSIKDILDYDAGGSFSNKALFGEMMSIDLRTLGREFKVPIVFIQGADDTLTPTSAVKQYYESIDAPQKVLVLIPGGGHMVSLAMPDEVLAAFLEHVRPLAVVGSH
jgi:pimeloyl-ACP methyl ester carboxylesterase